MTHGTCTHNGCERPIQARAMCTTHWSQWYRAHRKTKRTCRWCAATFSSAVKATYCSRSCAGKNANMASLESEAWRAYAASKAKSTALVLSPRPRTWRGTESVGRVWVSGPCPYCHAQFTARVGTGYCSPRCRQRAKEQRRTQSLGEFAISDAQRTWIYARDAFNCQLCSEPVDVELHYSHKMSATLDHIFPQSRGGGHDTANLRLAHRSCNAARGNRLDEA